MQCIHIDLTVPSWHMGSHVAKPKKPKPGRWEAVEKRVLIGSIWGHLLTSVKIAKKQTTQSRNISQKQKGTRTGEANKTAIVAKTCENARVMAADNARDIL